MIGRRALMQSAALAPLARRRRHQVGWESNSVFQVLIVPGGKGGGVFVYNGAPATGNPPVMFSVAPGTTKDPLGNNLLTNANANAVFGAGTVGGGQVVINSLGQMTFDNGVSVFALPQLLPDIKASLLLIGGQVAGADAVVRAEVFAKGDTAQAVPQVVMNRSGGAVVPATTALLEVQDQATISAAAAAGLVLRVINTTGGATNETVRIQAAATGDTFLACQVAGDTNSRVRLDTNASGFSELALGSGAAVADVFLGRTAANLLNVGTADLNIGGLGRGLRVKEGTNAKQGTAVLVAGTVTVTNTSVTANSRIFLTGQNSSGTAGELTVSARTAGTSFTITSSSGTDTRTVAWEIFEPAS